MSIFERENTSKIFLVPHTGMSAPFLLYRTTQADTDTGNSFSLTPENKNNLKGWKFL